MPIRRCYSIRPTLTPSWFSVILRVRSMTIRTLLPACLYCCISTSNCLASPRSELQNLSSSLAKQIRTGKIRTVVVADSLNAEGVVCPECMYFSDLTSAYLSQFNKEFKVLKRGLLGHTLEGMGMTVPDLFTLEGAQRVGKKIGADSILSGQLVKGERQISFSVHIRRVADGREIGQASTVVARSTFFDSLSTYPNSEPLVELKRVGVEGVSAPECLDCPIPQFRSKADSSSRALLSLAISREGRVVAVKVLRGAGPEFADEALLWLRVFRYQPARDRNGQPVAVAVFLEVFFSTKN
jgi:hypothetical protein